MLLGQQHSLSIVTPLKTVLILVSMLGSGKYIRLKHHPQLILAKRLVIQFVTEPRNIESPNVTKSALKITSLRDKYWQFIPQDINVKRAKTRMSSAIVKLEYLSSAPVKLLSSNHAAKYGPTKVFLIKSNAILSLLDLSSPILSLMDLIKSIQRDWTLSL